MPRIVIQQGHVPRRRGSTGAPREQEFVQALAPRIARRLEALGHTVRVIDAVTGDRAEDEAPAGWDAFVSLHIDGHNTRQGGASVGYPPGSDHSLADAWKREHARIYPGPWLPDNYTSNLSGYYMWRRTTGYPHRFLAEHGTSLHDLDWLFNEGDHALAPGETSNLDRCADAHVRAIGSVLSHPEPVDDEEEEMAKKRVLIQAEGDGSVYVFDGEKRQYCPSSEYQQFLADQGYIESTELHVLPQRAVKAIPYERGDDAV